MHGKAPTGHGLVLDEKGPVTVECAVVLTLVAVGLVLVIASLGPTLVSAFVARETWLLLPFP